MEALPFQIGVRVDELERVMAELSGALRVSWTRVAEIRSGEWDIRVVFSREGPPFFELVEGPPGSPWDAGGQSRIDHLGYCTDDYEADSARLEATLSRLRGDARRVHFALPGLEFHLELFDADGREAFYERLGADPRDQTLSVRPPRGTP